MTTETKNREKYNCLYGEKDPRYVPTYNMADASRILRLPYSTVRYWTRGRNQGQKIPPVIDLAEKDPPGLSFINLVELHVLSSIRRKHNVSLQTIRDSLHYVNEKLGRDNPLATEEFKTNGIDLFVEKFNRLINVSDRGQIVLEEVLTAYLDRIERDKKGLAKRLYPFARTSSPETQPKYIAIDPEISFGRPIIASQGIRTNILAERYLAGDSIEDLARDYNTRREEIEDAIRCELRNDVA